MIFIASFSFVGQSSGSALISFFFPRYGTLDSLKENTSSSHDHKPALNKIPTEKEEWDIQTCITVLDNFGKEILVRCLLTSGFEEDEVEKIFNIILMHKLQELAKGEASSSHDLHKQTPKFATSESIPFRGTGHTLGSHQFQPSKESEQAIDQVPVEHFTLAVDDTQPTTQISVRLQTGSSVVKLNEYHTIGELKKHIKSYVFCSDKQFIVL